MNKKIKSLTYILSSVLLGMMLLLNAQVLAAEPKSRPNVIFFLADDAGVGDFACYGSKYSITPNIVRLAAEGIRLTNAYCGNAVCAPSRCTLMTGLHPGHALFRANRKELTLAQDQLTVATLFKEAGYVTGGFGKWGIGLPGTTGVPEKHGFDRFFGYYDQTAAHQYYPTSLVENSCVIPVPENANGKRVVYSHNVIANETLKFIDQNKDKPFFIYAAWTLPHAEFTIPSPELFASKPWSQKVKNYAAMVNLYDQDIGRVMKKLKEYGIDDRTLVFFGSDNGANQEFIGPLASTGGLRGYKRMLYEGGIRAPLIARWPNQIPAGKTSDLLTGFVDIMATTADLLGSKTAIPSDGVSMLPTLLGKPQEKKHDHLYFEIFEPYFQQCVRWENWKGYRLGTKAPMELYNLKNDPKEHENVAAENPEIVKKLEALLVAEHVDSATFKAPEQPSGKASKGNKKSRKNGKENPGMDDTTMENSLE